MEEKWLTIDQVASLLECSNRTVERIIHRNRVLLDLRREQKENGGYRLLISASSLVQCGVLSPAATISQTLATEGNRLLASSIVRKNFTNLTVSESHLLNQVHPNWRSQKITVLVDVLANSLGVSRSWLYRDHTRDRRREKNTSLDRMTAEQRETLIREMIQFRNLKNWIRACRSNPNLPDLSERTWYRIGEKLQREYQDEIMLTRQGEVKLRQQTEPILRDKTYLKPLEVIVGDYWNVDRVVKWVDGELVSPSLSVWVDWRSNMIVGAALAKNPNSLGVKMSLFDCFTSYGIPQIAYMDNGKEYLAHRVIGESIESTNIRGSWLTQIEDEIKKFEFRGVLPSLGVQNLHAIARNPRAKIVERVFGRGGFTDWAKEFTDWIGRNYNERPEIVKKAIARHKQGRKFVDKITGQEFVFADLHILAAEIREFIEFHNTRPSKGFGMDGKSPLELYNELIKDHPPRRASVYDLAFAFMEGKLVKVRKYGRIEFKKDLFYRADKLWTFRGEQVYIRYNPIQGFWWSRADLKQFEFLPCSLLVFDERGKFIDQAEFVERQHPTSGVVSKQMREQRSIVSDAKDTVRQLNAGVPVVDVLTAPEEAVKEIEEQKQESEKEKRRRLRQQFGLIH